VKSVVGDHDFHVVNFTPNVYLHADDNPDEGENMISYYKGRSRFINVVIVVSFASPVVDVVVVVVVVVVVAVVADVAAAIVVSDVVVTSVVYDVVAPTVAFVVAYAFLCMFVRFFCYICRQAACLVEGLHL
jgi:hypothetical protein